MAALIMFGSVVIALWPRDRTAPIHHMRTTPIRVRPNRTSVRDEVWFSLVPVGLVLATSDVLSGGVIAICGPAIWWFKSKNRIAKAERARRDALPEVLDLIAMSVGAGMTVSGAIRLATTEAPEVVRPGFGSVLALAESGVPLALALPKLFDELGDSYNQLVSALVASVRDGAPLTELLSRLGDNARTSRRRRAEERGRRLPVAMMFPLSVCSMPAVLIGTVVPVVMVGLRNSSL